MTRERIEDMREVVLPFVKKRLLETNYEGLGKSDAEEFARDFNEILDLAIKALEQEPTPKNDLGVDCISRDDVRDVMLELWGTSGELMDRLMALPSVTPSCEDAISRQVVLDEMDKRYVVGDFITKGFIKKLPSVKPQEPQSFKWCTTCKEYDQEKHCCHRWSKVIRDTVEEMKQEQEPIKPMVEIDLYSVIKQKYIEREVLDKIRAEIKHFMYDVNPSSSESDYACNYILQIIDKYKAEQEK